MIVLCPAAGFSILVTAYNMIGNPVSCACRDCGGSSIPLEVMNAHCWVTATDTIRANLKELGFHPGLLIWVILGLDSMGSNAPKIIQNMFNFER